MFCGYCYFLCMCHQVEKVNCLFKRNIFAEKADNVCWNFFLCVEWTYTFCCLEFSRNPSSHSMKRYSLFYIVSYWLCLECEEGVRWTIQRHTEITLKAVILQMFIFSWSGEHPMWLSRKLSDCNNNHEKQNPKTLKVCESFKEMLTNL